MTAGCGLPFFFSLFLICGVCLLEQAFLLPRWSELALRLGGELEDEVLQHQALAWRVAAQDGVGARDQAQGARELAA